MRAWVVYDSVFGHTERVAWAIGRAFGGEGEGAVLPAGEVQPGQLTGLDWLIVGSPTRGFRPTETLAALLRGIPAGGLVGARVAAFDTRLAPADLRSPLLRLIVRTGGYAAPRIAARLEGCGGTMAAPPEGFFVRDTEGPLVEGELERAADWARRLIAGGGPRA